MSEALRVIQHPWRRGYPKSRDVSAWEVHWTPAAIYHRKRTTCAGCGEPAMDINSLPLTCQCGDHTIRLPCSCGQDGCPGYVDIGPKDINRPSIA